MKTIGSLLVLAACICARPAFAQQIGSFQPVEDVRAKESAQRLHAALKSGKLKLGADLYAILESYGDPHKLDIAEDVSELRYRYSKGFNQGYVLIWLYFDKDKKLVRWRNS